MTAPRNLRAASQPLKQTVDAARLVAHSILGLYPVPDLSRCLESPARHLLGQLPLLIWAQKPRLAPACHLVPQHSLHTSLSIPAHPRLYRPVVHSHSCRRLTELPSRPDQPQSMESCTKDNVMLCLVGCLQCRRCILQTPIDSKRSTHHCDAPQHSMLVTAWMNYKNTASYFQVSLSSNGIRWLSGPCPQYYNLQMRRDNRLASNRLDVSAFYDRQRRQKLKARAYARGGPTRRYEGGRWT